jgi:uncharacterized RDD family membrane protein YckC
MLEPVSDPNTPRPDRDPIGPPSEHDPNAPRPDRVPDLPQPAGGALMPPAPGAPPPATPPTPEGSGGAPATPGGVDEPVSRVPREPSVASATDDTVARAAVPPGAVPSAGAAPPPGAAPPRSYWTAPDDRPRGPAPGIAYAGFWIRLVAFIIDLIPLAILSVLVIAPFIGTFIDAISELPPPPSTEDPNSPEYLAWQRLLMQRLTPVISQLTPLSGLLQLVSALYYIGFWTWRGQTPGMMLLGLRVARESDGAPPGLARSILRYVGYFISQLVLFIGFIWVAFDSRKQGWHDKIAGTVVVRPAG